MSHSQSGRRSGPLGQLPAVGPFFAVDTHEVGEARPAGWSSLHAFLADDVAVRQRVEAVRAALTPEGPPAREMEARVAASVAHLGLVARLIAPWLAAPIVEGVRLSLEVEDLWWRDELGGPVPLSMVVSEWADEATQDLLASGSAVAAATHAVAAEFHVSDIVLWGNVASAVNSAARQLARARPDVAERAYGAADRVLGDPKLDGGKLNAGNGFRRRSCCLIYRITGDTAAVCGDCVLLGDRGAGILGR